MKYDHNPPLIARMEELCKKQNITITALCGMLGISRASVSDYKMGRSRSLSSDTVIKIAEYFNVSTDYLLRGVVSTGQNSAAETNPVPGSVIPQHIAFLYDEILMSEVFCIPAGDDSMTPRLCPGDRVFVQPISDSDTGLVSALPPDTPVLVRINSQTCIRSATVYRKSSDSDAQPDTVILRPWNPGYPVEIQGTSSIKGIVRGWYAKPN